MARQRSNPLGSSASPTKQREVVKTLGVAATLRLTLPPVKQTEVRQRQDGRWALFYSDPAFCPCDCSKDCKRETSAGPKMIEAHTLFDTLEEALAESVYYGNGKEPKVIPIETQSERMQRIWAERKAAQNPLVEA